MHAWNVIWTVSTERNIDCDKQRPIILVSYSFGREVMQKVIMLRENNIETECGNPHNALRPIYGRISLRYRPYYLIMITTLAVLGVQIVLLHFCFDSRLLIPGTRSRSAAYTEDELLVNKPWLSFFVFFYTTCPSPVMCQYSRNKADRYQFIVIWLCFVGGLLYTLLDKSRFFWKLVVPISLLSITIGLFLSMVGHVIARKTYPRVEITLENTIQDWVKQALMNGNEIHEIRSHLADQRLPFRRSRS